MQLHNVRELTFASYADDGKLFCYIIHDRRLDKMTCTCFQPDEIEEGRPSVRRAVDAAQRAYNAELKAKQEERVASAILDGQDPEKAAREANAEKEKATGAIIGVFEATYLGSTVVTALRGAEIVSGAVDVVVKARNVPQGVFVHVGTEGIKTFESLTHEVRGWGWGLEGGTQWGRLLSRCRRVLDHSLQSEGIIANRDPPLGDCLATLLTSSVFCNAKQRPIVNHDPPLGD